jgi:hypothetical protein
VELSWFRLYRCLKLVDGRDWFSSSFSSNKWLECEICLSFAKSFFIRLERGDMHHLPILYQTYLVIKEFLKWCMSPRPWHEILCFSQLVIFVVFDWNLVTFI